MVADQNEAILAQPLQQLIKAEDSRISPSSAGPVPTSSDPLPTVTHGMLEFEVPRSTRCTREQLVGH